jgi:hypothetical protein
MNYCTNIENYDAYDADEKDKNNENSCIHKSKKYIYDLPTCVKLEV